MELKIIYESKNVLVIDKPAGIVVFPEGTSIPSGQGEEKTLIDLLLEKYPYLKNIGEKPRHGIIHRLDKDTSGILLIAKNDKSFEFFQKQFKDKKVKKKYLVLATSHLKDKEGVIKTLLGRSQKDRKKQKVYLPQGPNSEGKRNAITFYKVLKKFGNYDLVEATPETGRKHQIRTHFVYIGHPIAGDKKYFFKNQLCPKGLNRQFLHASYLKIKLPNGKMKEFKSELPEDLKKTLENINK